MLLFVVIVIAVVVAVAAITGTMSLVQHDDLFQTLVEFKLLPNYKYS